MVIAIASQTALAQEQTSSQDAPGDEIVVTARGRDEKLTEVPVSITVFGEQSIKDAGVSRVDDFVALTPGVSIISNTDPSSTFINIRGAAQFRNTEAPVSITIDGVLQTNERSLNQPMFDIESIQMLRGPQGALYGRNATQGAIIINTKGPADKFEGYVQTSLGRSKQNALEASVSAPINENLAFRLSGRYDNNDGYFKNVSTGIDKAFKNEISLRGHLRYTAGDNFTADLRGSWTRVRADALWFTAQGVALSPTTGEVTSTNTGISDANVVTRWFGSNNRSYGELDVKQLSLRLNYDLGWAKISSVSAYDWLNQLYGADQFPYSANSSINPGISFLDGTQTQHTDIGAFSQELRITSQDDQRFRWMVGAYYLATNKFLSDTTGLDNEQGILRVTRKPFLGDARNPTTSFLASDSHDKAWALFFSTNYDIVEGLELSLAGRYDEDRRKQFVDPLNGAYSADGTLITALGAPGATNKATFSRFQPKVSLRYLISDDFSVYGSWGRGFRSGKFNQNGVSAQAASYGFVGVKDVAEQEDSDTFEGGFKATLLDGRISTSGAIYHTTFKNSPYFVFVADLGAQIILNIDRIRAVGGEFEMSAKLAPGLDANVGVAVVDAEIKKFAFNPAFVGNNAPYVAKSSVNAGLQYRGSLTDTLSLFSRVDYERMGPKYWDPENSTVRDPVNLVNVRLGIEDKGGKWQLTGTVQNLFDKAYNSEWITGGFASAALPRIWRVDLRYNF